MIATLVVRVHYPPIAEDMIASAHPWDMIAQGLFIQRWKYFHKGVLMTYLCYYKGLPPIEVESDSIYHAQLEGQKRFKAKHDWEVDVTLAIDRDGKEVIHVAVD